jgi:hypothetical protein
MAFELRRLTFDPAEIEEASAVWFYAGEGPIAEQSRQWISGLVVSELPNVRSLALHQSTLLRASDRLDGEIERLKRLYDQAQQAQSESL